jgi:hypothetical protein
MQRMLVFLAFGFAFLLVAGFQPRPARWNVNGPSKMRGRNVDVAIR